jgi:hypothetical protein
MVSISTTDDVWKVLKREQQCVSDNVGVLVKVMTTCSITHTQDTRMHRDTATDAHTFIQTTKIKKIMRYGARNLGICIVHAWND